MAATAPMLAGMASSMPGELGGVELLAEEHEAGESRAGGDRGWAKAQHLLARVPEARRVDASR
jgi:hypothetical protein